MGTETHFPIGTILTRRDLKGDTHDELRVVGGGKKLVVTSNTEFEGAFEMDSAVARAEYVAAIEGTELFATRPQYVERGPSPEQVFADIAREQKTGAATGKARRGRSAPTDGTPTVTTINGD